MTMACDEYRVAPIGPALRNCNSQANTPINANEVTSTPHYPQKRRCTLSWTPYP